jgi:ATP-dependent DNA ligase
MFKKLNDDPDYVAELKLNGTRLELHVFNSGERFEFWNRHKKILKYEPSKELLEHLRMIKWEGDCMADGELMHFKTIHIKHRVVLWDVFVWNGASLVGGKSEDERHKILEDAFGNLAFTDLYINPQYKSGFRKVYEENTERDEVEGLVMKSLKAKLVVGKRDCPIVKYLWKVRKPGPSYRGGEAWRTDHQK